MNLNQTYLKIYTFYGKRPIITILENNIVIRMNVHTRNLTRLNINQTRPDLTGSTGQCICI